VLHVQTTTLLKPPTPPGAVLGLPGDVRDVSQRLDRSEARLSAAQKRLQQKEEQLRGERRQVARLRDLGRQIEAQLHVVTEVCGNAMLQCMGV
jgi:chromosome segregation ATPase